MGRPGVAIAVTLATTAALGVPALFGATAHAAGPAAALTISARTASAGSSFSVTVRAVDSVGSTSSSIRDTVAFTSSDPAATLPSPYTFRSRDGGQRTFTVTLRSAGAQSLAVADVTGAGVASGSTVVPVTAASASRIDLAVGGTATAGSPTPVTVTARDPYGNVATTYARTVSFSSTDRSATLPTAYTFGRSDAGTHAFATTFQTAGSQTVTVRDSRLRTTSGAVAVTTSIPVTPPPPPPPPTGQQSVAVPAYFWPGAIWSTMVGSGPGVGIAVMNPNSGPGSAQSSEYVNAVAAAHSAGIKVLGYVDSTYATRPLADVEADVARYYSWYGVDGVFFDQAGTDCAQANGYYKALFDYVRGFGSNGHGNTVVLNPGTQTNECFMAVADIVMNFEGSYATYTTSYSAPAWVATYSAQRFWHIVYGTPLSAVASTVQLAAARNAGNVYVTDEGLIVTAPDAYLFDRLPAPSWWSAELAAVANS